MPNKKLSPDAKRAIRQAAWRRVWGILLAPPPAPPESERTDEEEAPIPDEEKPERED